MRIIQDLNTSDEYYDTFREMYRDSFPVHEQRDVKQQEYAFSRHEYHLEGYVHENILVAFIAWWEFGDYIYIEHFAVNPNMRGRNMGSDILGNFMKTHAQKIILLEIDPPADNLSRKRLLFYQRLGFVENPYQHRHPAYRTGAQPHELAVLTFPGSIPQARYDKFAEDLTEIVMGDPLR